MRLRASLLKFIAPLSAPDRIQLQLIGTMTYRLLHLLNQEEANTRMLLYAKDASLSGRKNVLIRAVDTDVVAISINFFGQLGLFEIWLAIGTGNHLRYIEIHKITEALGPEKSKCLPLFHAFTGCDKASLFAGRGKKVAWNTWNHFDELATSFYSVSLLSKLEDIINHSASIGRFAALLCDRTSTISTISTVSKCRKDLFA